MTISTQDSEPNNSDKVSAELAEIVLYKKTAWLNVEFAFLRSVGFILTVYLATAIFNLIMLVKQYGWKSLISLNIYKQALLLDKLSLLANQSLAATLSILSLVALAIFVSIISPILYERRKKHVRRQLHKYRKEMLHWWEKEFKPDESLNPDSINTWVQDKLDDDAPQRIKRLQQIEQWFNQDPQLMNWTLHVMQRKQLIRNLLIAILTPTAAVIISKLFSLLSIR